mmetsp:Transcript_9456/g.35409  ORF Transcript_9456/g.35409 Transcript_9456/m.35409 type:complete len:299 (+) Transcript_9456:679-1575(+)
MQRLPRRAKGRGLPGRRRALLRRQRAGRPSGVPDLLQAVDQLGRALVQQVHERRLLQLLDRAPQGRQRRAGAATPRAVLRRAVSPKVGRRGLGEGVEEPRVRSQEGAVASLAHAEVVLHALDDPRAVLQRVSKVLNLRARPLRHRHADGDAHPCEAANAHNGLHGQLRLRRPLVEVLHQPCEALDPHEGAHPQAALHQVAQVGQGAEDDLQDAAGDLRVDVAQAEDPEAARALTRPGHYLLLEALGLRQGLLAHERDVHAAGMQALERHAGVRVQQAGLHELLHNGRVLAEAEVPARV